MKPHLTDIVRQILRRYPDAQTSKKFAFQMLCRDYADQIDILSEINPDSFARIWRKYKGNGIS